MIVSIGRLRKAINESILNFLSEDKDRLRRALDGHTERVGPSHGGFEESIDIDEAGAKGSRTVRLDPQHKPVKKPSELRFSPSDPLRPKSEPMKHSKMTYVDPDDLEDIEMEDKDRLRRAADGHTERVGPSHGQFEEELELEKRGQKGKLSAGEERTVKGLKKVQKAGELPKLYVDPRTGKRKPTSIYAIAKALHGKKKAKEESALPEDIAIVSSDEDVEDVLGTKKEYTGG